MTQVPFIVDAAKIASDRQTPGGQVAVSFSASPTFVPGRRSWVKYGELGVTEATGRAMRAQVIHAGASNQNTGWHLHRCDSQFLYVLAGAIHIAFHPDLIVRLGPGDSIMIPGGTIHMELGAPEGVEVLEISTPGDMGTESVASPWPDGVVDFTKGIERSSTESV